VALPRSSLVIVGDELLAGFTVDSNGALAARRLFEAGYPVRRVEIVGDVVADIAASVRRAVDDPEVARIIVCGGVGPTPDDRTHEGVAAALGRDLVEDPTALRLIEAQVARMHRAGWLPSPVTSAANRRMARMASGGQVLENLRGMAPPLAVELDANRWLFVLPGVPREFEAALDRLVGDAALRAVLGDAGRAYVDRFYRWPVLIARYADFLTSVVARGRGTPGLL